VNVTPLPAEVFWKSAMTGVFAVLSTENPTTPTLSDDEPLDEPHPARTAGTTTAAAASAMILFLWVMVWISLL
jgi:hypothetical protein